MSPRTTFLLTLAGVLLVGAPLPLLTRVAEQSPAETSAEAAVRQPVYATLQFTGTPQAFRLRGSKDAWKEMDAASPSQDFELELPLSGRIEIEVEARWESTEPQAVTLTLEPDGYESRSETQWKEAGSNTLHSIFTFIW